MYFLALCYADCCTNEDATPLPSWLLVVTSGNNPTTEIVSLNPTDHPVPKALRSGLGILPSGNVGLLAGALLPKGESNKYTSSKIRSVGSWDC